MVSFIWKEGASEPLWRKTLISCSGARWIFWFRLFMIFLHQKSCNYFPSYFLKIHRQLTISFFQIYITTCISTNIKPVSWKFLYNIFLFLSNPWKSCFPFFFSSLGLWYSKQTSQPHNQQVFNDMENTAPLFTKWKIKKTPKSVNISGYKPFSKPLRTH